MKITRIVAAMSLALLAQLAILPARAQTALSQDNDSISVTTALTFQSIALADNGRVMLEMQNNNANTDNCWVNVDGRVPVGATTTSTVTNSKGVSVTAAQASILLTPGLPYTRYFPHAPSAAIVGTCASVGDSLYVGIH